MLFRSQYLGSYLAIFAATSTTHVVPQVKTENGVVDRVLSPYHIISVLVFPTRLSILMMIISMMIVIVLYTLYTAR